MACQLCHAAAPTRQVTLSQNVGLVILRFYSASQGQLCRNCIDREFWRRTLITAFFGWWGVISAIFTPLILAANVAAYGASLRMPREGPPGPWVPTADDERFGTYVKLGLVALVLSPVVLCCLFAVVQTALRRMGVVAP